MQSHFLANGSSGDGQWIIPLTLCCNSYNNQKKVLLKTKSDKLDIGEVIGSLSANTSLMDKSTEEKGGNFWIKFNVDQTGFYRVKYDDGLVAGLTNAVNQNQLSTTDRYGNMMAFYAFLCFSICPTGLPINISNSGLLEDSFALSMACKQTLSSLVLLLDAYRKENEYTVLSHIITVCATLYPCHFFSLLVVSFSNLTFFLAPQISDKVVYVAADGCPELLDDIKQFFTNLLQFSAQ